MRLVKILTAALVFFAMAAEPASAQRARTLTRGEARMLAQDVADAANARCEVGNAVVLGVDDDGRWMFEATCANGDGYLLHDAYEGARAIDCLALASLAESDPQTRTCRLSGNANSLGQIRRLARDAGIDCPVDAGRLIGVTPGGGRVIEVGCRGVDGFRIEQTDGGGWSAVPCLVLADQGDECRYTEAAEQAETARRWLAQDPGAACDVSGVRYMGLSGRGLVFEVGCRAAAGYVVRVSDAGVPTERVTCAEAAAIGDGCALFRP